MTLAVLAVLFTTAAVMLMWKRPQTRRTQAVLMLLGPGLAASGLLGGIQSRVADVATNASASLTGRLFGVGVAYAVALALVIWFALDMDLDGLAAKFSKRRGGGRNNHQTTAFTPWLGLMTPVMLAMLPGVSWVPSALREGMSTLAVALVG